MEEIESSSSCELYAVKDDKRSDTHQQIIENEASISFYKLFKENKLVTITYCAVFWSFGMCVSFLGPTLLELRRQVNADFRELCIAFFVENSMLLVGCIFCGCIVQRCVYSYLIIIEFLRYNTDPPLNTIHQRHNSVRGLHLLSLFRILIYGTTLCTAGIQCNIRCELSSDEAK